ncbi:TetR/AcrR family transcriptional regulator [Streptomyces sp. NBC_00536]|uniref:TetR/AcrR family transcriptional regulator n=1 Tax=Streptomyces sp. NBC_00536 TaxID=2975769 RepID=UPI002E8209A6|nr:TetR/AcrR family transcriptional regulator [Streptomyces sp. NBC_00536]WUC77587.1 TetR/AcrR family transcriptional regulator [Streptomyces sp. NBC_00536]
MNQDRRDLLRDAAIDVLAEAGGRGLTHRAVDAVAGVPLGTAKNYFPTRDALLRAVAERCLERYRELADALAGAGPGPTDRAGLAALFAGLLRDAAGPGRPRVLAYLELRTEAARRPWLAALLDPIATADFAAHAALLRTAGLPATAERARALTLALHGAVPQLLAGAPQTLTAAGLDDLDGFARGVLDAVCPPARTEPTP